MSGPSLVKPPTKLLPAPVISIREPKAFSSTDPTSVTNVRCPGAASGALGTICAHGMASWDAAPLTAVWAKVYSVTTVSYPSSHPTDGSAVQGVAPTRPGGHFWQFIATEIPVLGACCPAAPPTANNGLLVVWCTFGLGSGPQDVVTGTLFAGVASNRTNCQGSGSGSHGDIEIARVGAGTTTLETAPRQWQVSGQGFSDTSVAHLNALWILELRSNGRSGACIWDNGGDGVRVPHVELRCDGLLAIEWRLTLTHADRRIHSVCSAREWNALGVNRLTASAETGNLEELRGSLTVTPV